MRKGRSISTPTKEEAARIVAVKEGPCLACLIFTGREYPGCDAHHLLSGGRRIGHMATLGLCGWHHRGVVTAGFEEWFRIRFGPSLMDGSRIFHEAYGSDEELLEKQNRLLATGSIE